MHRKPLCLFVYNVTLLQPWFNQPTPRIAGKPTFPAATAIPLGTQTPVPALSQHTTRPLCTPATGRYIAKVNTMDKDRIAGSAKVVKGKVKEAVGKVLGDAKLNAEGKADQVAGTAQNAVGGIKDALRGK